MRIPRAARHALVAAMEMAAAGGEPVPAAEAARRHGLPPDAMAKVFQRLVRAGLASGFPGVGGGYRLARDPAEVSVQEVIALFDPPRAEGRGSRDPHEARLRALFGEVDEVVRSTLASVTVATLVRGPYRPPAAMRERSRSTSPRTRRAPGSRASLRP